MLPLPYEVFIGKNPERIYYPQKIGHQYVYFDKLDNDGYWGIMEPIHVVRKSLLP